MTWLALVQTPPGTPPWSCVALLLILCKAGRKRHRILEIYL